jgi:hypothetical protein
MFDDVLVRRDRRKLLLGPRKVEQVEEEARAQDVRAGMFC